MTQARLFQMGENQRGADALVCEVTLPIVSI